MSKENQLCRSSAVYDDVIPGLISTADVIEIISVGIFYSVPVIHHRQNHVLNHG